ncbi:transposase [Bacteroides neonati]|uniref:transposase n=1 Tax=Bacteroides neonati TaxID=1347393 RepID=UPI0009455015
MKEKTLSLTKKLTSTTRRKFSKQFKTKVVLKPSKEHETLESLAQRYEFLPTQIFAWETQALQNIQQTLPYLICE